MGLREPFAVAVVRAFIGAIASGTIAVMAMRIGGGLAGYGAGFFAAAYPHFVIWTEQLLTETLFVALTVLALWLLIESSRRGRARWMIVASVALGAAALVRSEALAFVPIAAVIV